MTLGLKKHYFHANLFFSTLARSRLDLYNLRRIACDTPLMLLFSLLNVPCLSLSSSMACYIYESGALIILMFCSALEVFCILWLYNVSQNGTSSSFMETKTEISA